MKTFASFTIVLTLLLVGTARQTVCSSPSQDPCGNPGIESTGRSIVEGTVTGVIDGRSISVALEDQTQLLVKLGGIDTSKLGRLSLHKAQEFLHHMAFGKKVVLTIEAGPWTFKTPRPKKVTAVVQVDDPAGRDLSLTLLHQGMVRYEEPKAYSISGYKQCTYRRAEEDAREHKRGIWL